MMSLMDQRGRAVDPPQHLSRRITAAIYLDFDNVFSGLIDLDEEAAIDFAQRPGDWLDRLRVAMSPSGSHRDFLIRRCYLNPAGWKVSEKYGNEQRRVYFSRFRPFLTRLGFDVVDCPTLTSQGKNAADIRIALDVVDALSHATRFDEFILLSGDADFTPVLQRVREHDRRTVVVSSSQTAKAYEATVDTFLDEQSLIELIRPEETFALSRDVTAEVSSEDSHALARVDLEALRKQAVDLALEVVGSADAPVPLASLANSIRAAMGDTVNVTNWFGRGSLTIAIDDERTAHLNRSQHYIWDPARHKEPPPPKEREMPGVINEIATVTGMPRLTPDEYRAVFAQLAEWAAENPFNLTAITKDARDRLDDLGEDIGRKPLGFIVRGAMYGGVPLNREPAPDAAEISRGFLQSVLQAAAAARLELSDEEQAAVADWVLFRG